MVCGVLPTRITLGLSLSLHRTVAFAFARVQRLTLVALERHWVLQGWLAEERQTAPIDAHTLYSCADI